MKVVTERFPRGVMLRRRPPTSKCERDREPSVECQELGEGLLDGGDNAGIARGHVRGEAGEDGAVAANEEFFEVPEDAG